MLLRKNLEAEQSPVPINDPDLALVAKQAHREIREGEVWLGRQKLANTRVDRSGERFPRAYLERFAATAPGKAVMPGHDYTKTPLGRYYKAEVLPDGDGYALHAWYYLNARNEELVSSIELGILKDVSIGFNAGRRVCDLCGEEWRLSGKSACDHWPLEEYDGRTCTLTYCETQVAKAEMMEGSFVWAGCQYDATAIPKAAAALAADPRRVYMLGAPALLDAGPQGRKEQAMTMDEALAEIARLQGEGERLKGELVQTKAAGLDPDAAKALREELVALKAAAPLAHDGEKYRTWLKGEILRLAEVLEKRATYEGMLGHLGGADAGTLLPMLGDLTNEFNKKFAPAPTGLNGTPPDEPAPKVDQGLVSRLTGGLL